MRRSPPTSTMAFRDCLNAPQNSEVMPGWESCRGMLIASDSREITIAAARPPGITRIGLMPPDHPIGMRPPGAHEAYFDRRDVKGVLQIPTDGGAGRDPRCAPPGRSTRTPTPPSPGPRRRARRFDHTPPVPAAAEMTMPASSRRPASTAGISAERVIGGSAGGPRLLAVFASPASPRKISAGARHAHSSKSDDA